MRNRGEFRTWLPSASSTSGKQVRTHFLPPIQTKQVKRLARRPLANSINVHGHAKAIQNRKANAEQIWMAFAVLGDFVEPMVNGQSLLFYQRDEAKWNANPIEPKSKPAASTGRRGSGSTGSRLQKVRILWFQNLTMAPNLVLVRGTNHRPLTDANWFFNHRRTCSETDSSLELRRKCTVLASTALPQCAMA